MDVFGPLSKHDAASTSVQGVRDISANVAGAFVVIDDAAKHLLDGEVIGARIVK